MKKKTNQPNLSVQLDQWMFYGFLAIVVAIPLAMSRITYDQFDIAKIAVLRVLTLIILAFWIWRMLVAREPELRWSKLDFAVIGFLSLVFISTVTSIHIPTAIHGKYKRYEGLLTFVNYGIIYFLALQIFTSFGRLEKLSKATALTGGLVALYGVMQYMGADPLPWATLPFEERRSFSTFGNPDLLGGFLVIAVPLAVVEFLRARDLKENILMGSNMFLVLLCLLTAFVRGAWVGSVIAFVVFVAVGARMVLARPKKILFILAIFVSIFLVIAIYSASTGHDVLNLVERIKSMANITEGSAGSRIEIWKAGLGMIKEDPIFGLGPDTFRLGSERYETLEYVKMNAGRTVADNAHNYPVQLAAGVGVPAALLLFAFFTVVIVISSRRAFKMQGDERLVYAGIIASTIGYLVHLVFGVSISGSTGVFWVLIGALAATTLTVSVIKVNKKELVRTSVKIAMIALIVVSMISAYYGIAMYTADYSYAQAITLANSGNVETAIASFERAISLYKNGRYYDGYGMLLERIGMAQRDLNLLSKSSMVYKQGTDWEPYEADHHVFLAGSLAKQATGPDDPVLIDAIRELRETIRIRPYSIPAHLLLGNILLFQQKFKEAIEMSNFVLKIDPGDTNALNIIAKSYEGLGNKEDAKQYYEKILSLKPDDQGTKESLENLGK